MIKAIILDIDGTLTNSQKEITAETKEALLKAQKMGIRLAIASARSENGLRRFGRWLDFEHNNGIFICYNGGLIINSQTKQIYYEKAMPTELAKEILEHLKQFDCIPMINKDEYIYLNDAFNGMIQTPNGDMDIIQYETRSNEFLICEKADLADFVDFEVPKIFVAASSDYMAENADKMGAPFKERARTGMTAPFYYEFNAKGVEKDVVIERAFYEMGISSDDMMAIGDAKNDVAMLKYVKYGIAMGNAIDELKEVTYEVSQTTTALLNLSINTSHN
ncbi:Cof-type HAD-IIB family hydrolase [Streptococcus uberis]|uniref:Cof-type HAD-IIB family hydrolase n=1 Tax=Streptococcus uberis TaxID=1349 RepID=UPI0027DC5AEB|nr:Cof-type HAD-IIB family hydrolase [Streptococcus uberis]MCK1192684.1 Cof-type HAD-IIB family hydrolase [Streptococcus uberis]